MVCLGYFKRENSFRDVTDMPNAITPELTIRQKIIEALKGNMLTAREISGAVGVKEKEVIEHLPHIERSVSGNKSGRFVIESPECLECGFSFRKRQRLKTPSRCPICRSEGIKEMRFGIVGL